MLNIDVHSCTGCHACEIACPRNCICFTKDEFGFIYPNIDGENCINCGLCEKVCHTQIEDKNKLLRKPKARTAYYGWVKDRQLQMNSSSGGAFSIIVEKWLDAGGYVFGAAYNETNTYVQHMCFSKEEYAPLRKSKYVFSDLKDSYKKAKEYLVEGRKVVFSGTPCQVAGLKTFLGKNYSNLLTLDFICHGTPSIDFMNQHLAAITKGANIDKVDFRSKALGWLPHCLKIQSGNYVYIKHYMDDFYMKSFMDYSILRECCYSCEYSDGHHVSDVTIGDFWEIRKYDPSYIENKGVSLIIFNISDAEKEIYPLIREEMDIKKLPESAYSYVYKTHDYYDLNKRKDALEQIKEKGFGSLSLQWMREEKHRHIVDFITKVKKKIGL